MHLIKYRSEIILLTKSKYEEELRCWLNWHLNIIGFDHITIFDNESLINIRDVIKNFSTDKISYFRLNGWPNQLKLYTDYLKSSSSEWIIPIDDDEFLYISDKYNHNVNTFLDKMQFTNGTAFYMPWLNLFSHDYIEYKNGLYIENNIFYSYYICDKIEKITGYTGGNNYGKCLVNTSNSYMYMFNSFFNSRGYIPVRFNGNDIVILENGEIVVNEKLNQCDYNKNCFIAHYQYKCNSEWQNKCNTKMVRLNTSRPKSHSVAYKLIYNYTNYFKECTLLKEEWLHYKTKNI